MRARAGRGRIAGAALILALTLAACSRPSLSGLHNSVSGCYRAIPVATGAVRDPKAHLVGVHRVAADTVISQLPPGERAVVEEDTVVCAVAFKGPFTTGQVLKAPPTEQGEYAIVLVTTRKLQVVASYVLSELPKRFRGRLT